MPTDRHGNRRRIVYSVDHGGPVVADALRRPAKRLRRARRRWDIQQIRKLRRRGQCPCGDVRIENPGPDHLPSCPWGDPDYPEGNPF